MANKHTKKGFNRTREIQMESARRHHHVPNRAVQVTQTGNTQRLADEKQLELSLPCCQNINESHLETYAKSPTKIVSSILTVSSPHI